MEKAYFNVGDRVKIVSSKTRGKVITGIVVINDEQWLDPRFKDKIRYTVLIDEEYDSICYFKMKLSEINERKVLEICKDYKGYRYIYAEETEMTKIDTLDKIIANLNHKKPDKDIGVTVEEVIKAVEKLKELEKELKMIDNDITYIEKEAFKTLELVFTEQYKSSYSKYKPLDFLGVVKETREKKRLECVEQRNRIQSYIK